jgi:hypothetical protein
VDGAFDVVRAGRSTVVEEAGADAADDGRDGEVDDGAVADPAVDVPQPATARRQVTATKGFRTHATMPHRTALPMPRRAHGYAGTRHR